MKLTERQRADIKKIQEMMHFHGIDRFKDVVREAAWCAHEDTEDLENRKISEKWRQFFDLICDNSTIDF